jgi:hypothetical protein
MHRIHVTPMWRHLNLMTKGFTSQGLPLLETCIADEMEQQLQGTIVGAGSPTGAVSCEQPLRSSRWLFHATQVASVAWAVQESTTNGTGVAGRHWFLWFLMWILHIWRDYTSEDCPRLFHVIQFLHLVPQHSEQGTWMFSSNCEYDCVWLMCWGFHFTGMI